MDASFLGGGEKGHCRNEKLQSGWRNCPQNRHAQFTSTTTSLMADERERCWSQFSGQKKKTKWPQNTIDKTNKNSFAACNWGTRGGKKQYSKRKKNRRFKKFAPPIGSDVRKNLTASGAHHYVYVHGYTQNIQCAGIFTGNLFLAQRRVRAAPKKAWRERINLGDDKGKTSERASP